MREQAMMGVTILDCGARDGTHQNALPFLPWCFMVLSYTGIRLLL